MVSKTRAGVVVVTLVFALGGCDQLFNPSAHRWNNDLAIEVSYKFFTRLDGPSFLWAYITGTNTGKDPLQGITGGCHWWLRVYSNPGRTGTPIWTLEDSPNLGCQFNLVEINILPGESFDFRPARGDYVSEILGDRPSATYYFTAVLELDEPNLRTKEFNAGELHLSNPNR